VGKDAAKALRSTAGSGTNPASRPLQGLADGALKSVLEWTLAEGDGPAAAHCIHELWMRGEMSVNIERALARAWAAAADSIPEWLPMRYVDRLADVYDIALSFRASGKGRSNVYLVLLDYRDSRDEPYGFYVGMSRYSPAQRFDQHKAGIRAAGSVLKRGLEVLTGPVLHLQCIKRSEAVRIEEQLAQALRAAGFFVQGGH
jgi:predicted GIY-YIG superfamily endonuclease